MSNFNTLCGYYFELEIGDQPFLVLIMRYVGNGHYLLRVFDKPEYFLTRSIEDLSQCKFFIPEKKPTTTLDERV